MNINIISINLYTCAFEKDTNKKINEIFAEWTLAIISGNRNEISSPLRKRSLVIGQDNGCCCCSGVICAVNGGPPEDSPCLSPEAAVTSGERTQGRHLCAVTRCWAAAAGHLVLQPRLVPLSSSSPNCTQKTQNLTMKRVPADRCRCKNSN